MKLLSGLAESSALEHLARFRSGRIPATAGAWSARAGLSARQWIVLVKLFDAGLTLREMRSLLDLPQTTLHRALEILRLSLADRDPHWRKWVAQYVRGGGAAPIFGVLEEKVRIRTAPLCGEGLDVLQSESRPHVLHVNGFTYTSAAAGYRALIGHGAALADFSLREAGASARCPLFLRYVKIRMARCRGVSPRSFGLHLKEWELRYNLDGRSLCEYALSSLARDPAFGDS